MMILRSGLRTLCIYCNFKSKIISSALTRVMCEGKQVADANHDGPRYYCSNPAARRIRQELTGRLNAKTAAPPHIVRLEFRYCSYARLDLASLPSTSLTTAISTPTRCPAKSCAGKSSTVPSLLDHADHTDHHQKRHPALTGEP